MAARRQDKINEEVARELTSIPRVSGAFISVTGADVSRDLSLARVYYSVLGSADGADKGLASAAGYIRSELAARLNLRVTPKLVFLRDDSAERAMKISEILKDIDEDGNAER